MRRYGLVDIPDLASDIDAVPITRTITINGTTYDLSADRTWSSVGTNIYNTNGTLTSARTLTSGGFNLTFTGSNTASSAIARGILMNHTLVAAANSDVLSALDIQPTFTNGAFTGVSNLGLRIIFSGTGTGVGNYLSIINNTYPVINSGGVIAIYAQNSEVFYASTVQTIIKGRTTTSQLNFNLGATEFGRFFPTTGNLALQNGGTFTDGGQRLQVTGDTLITGNLTVDTNTFFVDATNNRVGIGTTSPNFPLTLDKSSSYTLGLLNSNIGTIGQYTGLTFGYTGTSYQKGALYFISKSSNGVGDLIFALNNAENSSNVSTSNERMRIDASGNVGIGTASPLVNLEVNGSIRSTRSGVASQYLQIEGGDAVGPFITAVGAAKVLTIRNNSTTSSVVVFDQAVASGYFFKQATVEKFSIYSSSNVGISTTADAGYRLDVNGTGRFVSSLISNNYVGSTLGSGGIYFSGDASPDFGYLGYNYTNVSGTESVYQSIRESWRIRFGNGATKTMSFGMRVGSAAASSWSEYFYLTSGGTATFSSSVTATSLIKSGGTSAQYLMADGSTSTLTNPVTGTGTTNYLPKFTGASALGNSQIFDNGTNVGIGTASPSQKLHIGGVGSAIAFDTTGATGTSIIQTVQDYKLSLKSNRGTSTEIKIGDSNLEFLTNSTERMRITSGGNLLVGTTTDAGFKLDVSGTIRGTSSITGAQFLASNTNGLSLSDNAVGGFLSYGYNSGRTNAAGHYFYNGISTELMRITSGGNVGIGTASPTAAAGTALAIYGGASQARLALKNSATGDAFEDGLQIGVGTDGGAFLEQRENNYMILSTNAIERMRITSGGNLLVGTTTDSGQKLQVNGQGFFNSTLTTYSDLVVNNNTSSGWIYIDGSQSSKNRYSISNQINGISNTGLQLRNETLNTSLLYFVASGAATFSSSVTASSLIKSGGTSAQILAADGSVITAGTNITISGGTISSSSVSMAIGGSITSATAGSVLFAGTSGVLAQDNANFFWDDSNNRLGIGTATPSNKLSIVETTNVASGFNVTNTTAGTSNSLNMNLFADTTAGYLQFQKRSSTHTATGIAAASSGLLYNSAGDLIIGTGGATSWIRFATNGIATADMNLTANGRLLLGTSTESTYILDVNGTFRSQGDAYASTKAWVGTNETTSPGALTVYSTSAANQIRIVGTTPATVYTDIFGSGTPTIVGAVGGVSTTNNFVTGTVVGDFVVTNQLTTKRLYCVSNTGGVYLATNATSWTANSDITLKNINSYITNAVDKLMNLSVINYHLKDDITKKEQIGLIAQEVKQVFPEIIEESEIGILGLRYTEIIPILVKAIQELKNEIDKLKINN